MKLSDMFTDAPWTVATLVLIVISVLFLNRGLKSGLPMGACYAVWVGIGAVGSIFVGIILFEEVLSIIGWIFMAVILVGIIGLNLVTESDEGENQQ